MIVEFRSPDSIVAWIATAPSRHVAQLRLLWRLWPDMRDSIEVAVALWRERGS